MTTGWFGIPGKSVHAKVHLVVEPNKTLCGWKPPAPYQLQHCASGLMLEIVECARCRAIAGKYLAMQTMVNTSGRAYKGTQRIL